MTHFLYQIKPYDTAGEHKNRAYKMHVKANRRKAIPFNSTKAYREDEVWLHTFLSSALYEGVSLTSRPIRFPPAEELRYPLNEVGWAFWRKQNWLTHQEFEPLTIQFAAPSPPRLCYPGFLYIQVETNSAYG
jgi:hypothetical protein